jgi:serine/threonine protein kinase
VGAPPYQIIRRLGEGGFAVVDLATNGQPEPVALKTPKSVPQAKERMRREIEMQQRYAHKHVMPILDADPDEPWFVMPQALGNLADLWSRGDLGNDPESFALDMVRAIAEGLRAAHADGAVHRDLTPGNILALQDDSGSGGPRWVVADWGLVRRPSGQTSQLLTGSQAGMGTPGFGAPETWANAHGVDYRADVYSVGRILAWLLTGQSPIWNLPLLPTGVLRGLVAQCTESDPVNRPESLDAALVEMEQALNRPATSPRGAVRRLIETQGTDANVLTELRPLARYNLEDERLFIDELAKLDASIVRAWAKTEPDEASEIAVTMCRHLQRMEWGQRDFNYANVPLGWAFAVLRQLVRDHHFDLAEDVGAAFFEVEAQWNRFGQLDNSLRWLKALSGEGGEPWPERCGVVELNSSTGATWPTTGSPVPNLRMRSAKGRETPVVEDGASAPPADRQCAEGARLDLIEVNPAVLSQGKVEAKSSASRFSRVRRWRESKPHRQLGN